MRGPSEANSVPEDAKCDRCIGLGTNIGIPKHSSNLKKEVETCRKCAGTGLRVIPTVELNTKLG